MTEELLFLGVYKDKIQDQTSANFTLEFYLLKM